MSNFKLQQLKDKSLSTYNELKEFTKKLSDTKQIEKLQKNEYSIQIDPGQLMTHFESNSPSALTIDKSIYSQQVGTLDPAISIPNAAQHWATSIGTSDMEYDPYSYKMPKTKNLEIEQLDGTKTLIRVSFDDLSDIRERVLETRKLVWKLPFPKYEITKTTYVSFHNKKDNKDYTAKCSLATFAKAFEVEYQSFGELLFDSALSGVDA